jgi:predicted nucleotidyltransferase
MRPSEALAKHRDEVLAIIARYPVSNPRVFGSVARGEDKEGSDVDILVEPQFGVTTFVHLGELQAELANLLGTEVDVLTPGGLRQPVASRIAGELSPL